jgi:hypothetical protein
MHWDELANGALLGSAARAGFDVVLCIDKKIEFEQNLKTLPLPVIIRDAMKNTIPRLRPFIAPLLATLDQPLEKVLYCIEANGQVTVVREPRPKRPSK